MEEEKKTAEEEVMEAAEADDQENQFYSPLTNKRTDEYGAGTLEGRLRLHGQVIRAVREAVGQDYPVAVRLGACDYTAGGTTREDSVAAAAVPTASRNSRRRSLCA